MKSAALVLAALSLLAATPAFAKSSTRIHVDVKDGSDGDTVQIDLPLSIARAALSFSGDSHVRIDNSDMDLAKVRKMWADLKATNEDAIVKATSGTETVELSAKKGQVNVEVKDKKTGARKVFLHVPADAMDALLSGKDGQLDLGAALASLQANYAGDLITVDDEDSHVRIWLD